MSAPAPAAGGGRGGLLAQIQAGKKLRKVSRVNAPVKAKKSRLPTSSRTCGGLSTAEPINLIDTLQAAMRSRAQIIQEEDTDDNASDWSE